MEASPTSQTNGDRVVAIVLAAGAASRMGRSKLTLPLGDSTVIGTTLAAVEGSRVDDVIVVVGHHGQAVREAVAPGVSVVENPDPSRGNVSSLAVGLEAIGDAGAAVILPADLPTVWGAAIDNVIDAWRGGACVAALVEYSDALGHPLLIDRSMFDVAGALHGAKALWHLVEALDPEVVRRVRVDHPKPLDINREADYLLAVQQMG
jgi:molybdenum cofactor cytidylyltransferase